MKILFIGNSYTYYNDMPKLFEAMAKENKKEVSVDSVTKGGRKLLENTLESDENHKTILALCERNEYDFLILQEHSWEPIRDFELFKSGVTKLKSLVNPKKTLLYATWERKTGAPHLSDLDLTSEEMTDVLFEKYSKVKDDIGALISPVGLAFKYISKNHPKLELYNPDLSHPSYFGSVLAAACHYTTIFEEIPKAMKSLNVTDKETSAICDAIKSIKTHLDT